MTEASSLYLDLIINCFCVKKIALRAGQSVITSVWIRNFLYRNNYNFTFEIFRCVHVSSWLVGIHHNYINLRIGRTHVFFVQCPSMVSDALKSLTVLSTTPNMYVLICSYINIGIMTVFMQFFEIIYANETFVAIFPRQHIIQSHGKYSFIHKKYIY